MSGEVKKKQKETTEKREGLVKVTIPFSPAQLLAIGKAFGKKGMGLTVVEYESINGGQNPGITVWAEDKEYIPEL